MWENSPSFRCSGYHRFSSGHLHRPPFTSNLSPTFIRAVNWNITALKPLTPIADARNRCVGVLVDAPNEKRDWNHIMREATKAIRHVATKVDLDALPTHAHQNLPFSLRVGIDYYGFSPLTVRPRDIAHESVNLIELACLCGKSAFNNIAEWQNGLSVSNVRSTPTCACSHVKYQLLDHDRSLRDVFPGSAFHAAEWFLGNAESPPRLDHLEMLWSLRGLTVLGKYNPRWGGQLILWEEKKVIKSPPGSTFLFPAAFTRYSFTQVRASEYQYAFSQYSQAGPFRYVDNDFQSDQAFEDSAWRGTWEAHDRRREARRTIALGMYSTLSEIEESL
ncbi:hypothetical protein C8R43DRAFT_1124764 [Mycena crocata]|nr:hypothetical protein C8R43DRAFT_1124764 [Mycena crocata]